jgi:hypothetical protein
MSVRGLGLCSDWVVAIDSESSDLAVAMDSDWVAARDSDRVVAMDSELAVSESTDSNREDSAQVGIDSDQLAAMDSEVAAVMTRTRQRRPTPAVSDCVTTGQKLRKVPSRSFFQGMDEALSAIKVLQHGLTPPLSFPHPQVNRAPRRTCLRAGASEPDSTWSVAHMGGHVIYHFLTFPPLFSVTAA